MQLAWIVSRTGVELPNGREQIWQVAKIFYHSTRDFLLLFRRRSSGSGIAYVFYAIQGIRPGKGKGGKSQPMRQWEGLQWRLIGGVASLDCLLQSV